MAALGAAKTGNFVIGQFEVRIGTLAQAGRLTSAHSVGVVDSYSYGLTLETTKLMAGFPRKTLDQAITSIDGELTFTGREYSARNINVLLGNAVADYDAPGGDLIGTVDTTSAILAAEDTLVLTTDVAFTAGQTVTIYSTTDPTKVTVSIVQSYTSGTKTLVLKTGYETLHAYDAGESVKVSLANVIGGGNITGVNYFSAQLVSVNRADSRPVVIDFWKCAVGAGLKVANSGTEFSAQEWSVGVLVPTASDYATGGPLHHVADVIPANPVMRLVSPKDFK